MPVEMWKLWFTDSMLSLFFKLIDPHSWEPPADPLSCFLQEGVWWTNSVFHSCSSKSVHSYTHFKSLMSVHIHSPKHPISQCRLWTDFQAVKTHHVFIAYQNNWKAEIRMFVSLVISQAILVVFKVQILL